jgi:cytochrome c oxidase subunit 5a
LIALSYNLLDPDPCQLQLSSPQIETYRLLKSAVRFNSGGAHAHETESYESFNTRYSTFFQNVPDVFELQRGLNNCFAYDLVPSTQVIESALRAARRVDDYATAVRILEGVKEKVENKGQYEAYLQELKPVISELGESNGSMIGFEKSSSLLDTTESLEKILSTTIHVSRPASSYPNDRPLNILLTAFLSVF